MGDIVVSQNFSAPSETVWKAITRLDQMREWFFNNIPAFQAEVGFTTEFLVSNEGRNFTHQWEIIEVIEQKRIVYDWRYKEWPGAGTVAFDLASNETGSTLTVTSSGMHSFPQDIPEFKRESCQGGWEYFIGQELKRFLGEG